MRTEIEATEFSPIDGLYLQRCVELARLGGAVVCPNPQVGAVLVARNRIIGEGYHQYFGGAHAEVNAFAAVKTPELLPEATLYVNLEPCSHYGKTPPCVDLILEKKVSRVVIGTPDLNPQVAGIEKLQAAGVTVVCAPDPTLYLNQNRFFVVNQCLERPYITLKWAESANGFIGKTGNERLLISGPMANKYVHALRSQYQAIMIGKNTARKDNPALTNRYYYGNSPIRIVLDADLSLPQDLHLFSSDAKVIIINKIKHEISENIQYFVPDAPDALMRFPILLKELYTRCNIGSILVEGGRFVLQQFINHELFDEIIMLRADASVEANVPAPILPYNFYFDSIQRIDTDCIFSRTINRVN